MGSVAQTEDTPSLKPGGRYPASAARVWVGWRGVVWFAPAGGGHAGRRVSPRDGRPGPAGAGGGFSPRGIRPAGDAGSPDRV